MTQPPTLFLSDYTIHLSQNSQTAVILCADQLRSTPKPLPAHTTQIQFHNLPWTLYLRPIDGKSIAPQLAKITASILVFVGPDGSPLSCLKGKIARCEEILPFSH